MRDEKEERKKQARSNKQTRYEDGYYSLQSDPRAGANPVLSVYCLALCVEVLVFPLFLELRRDKNFHRCVIISYS